LPPQRCLVDHGLQHALPNIVGPHPAAQHRLLVLPIQQLALPPCSWPGQFRGRAAPGVYGTAGRNILRGPGSIGTDFSLHRDFVFSESRELEFRWEVFNVANHPLFGLPVTNMSGTSAGAITTLAGDPRIMQFALRLKF
jgi:hypothetical protein